MPWSISKWRHQKARERERQQAPPPVRRPRATRWSVLLLGLLYLAGMLALLSIGGGEPAAQLAVGQKAPITVVSLVEFTCQDPEKTALFRQQAAEATPPVFNVTFEEATIAARAQDKLFKRLDQVRADPATQDPDQQVQRLAHTLDLLGIDMDAADLLRTVPALQAQEILNALKEALRLTYSAGILEAQDGSAALAALAPSGLVSLAWPDGRMTNAVPLRDLATPEGALAAAVAAARKAYPGDSADLPPRMAAALLRPWIKPNLVYDPVATARLREAAAAQVLPAELVIAPDTTLVEAGERITPAILEKLRQHDRRLHELRAPRERWNHLLGAATLLLMALVVFASIIQPSDARYHYTPAQYLLMLLLAFMAQPVAKGWLYLAGTTNWVAPHLLYLLPLGIGPLLGALLMNVPVAMAVGFLQSLGMALLLGQDFMTLVLGLLMTAVAVGLRHEIHRRASLFRAGLLIGSAEVICALAGYLADPYSLTLFLSQAAMGLANGLLCAGTTLLLLPVFESLFGITTDIRLWELSDPGRPLLQRLAMNAPGTYHHSLMVAQLAYTAAQAIGANPLLARVGAYYHDIGKLTKPDFFIENTRLHDNPHDELTPHMSALVLISHVKEGLSLAQRYRLPAPLADAIREHHGTSLIRYFYQRATEQQQATAGDAPPVSEAEFRYPGPKPRAPEMAILALADAVEAASRSLEKPTAGRLESMVQEIVDAKIRDGQLDDCQLTMAQLTAIRSAFVFTLAKMRHDRVAYPQSPGGTTRHDDKDALPS